jgi:monoamine oxidase
LLAFARKADATVSIGVRLSSRGWTRATSDGRIGDSFGSATRSSRAQQFLSHIDPVLRGIKGQFNDRATLDYSAAYPWTRGPYSYSRRGQYTRFDGAVEQISGACHFAGEHTTQDYQGYLQGAVFSGGRAASEVLAALR